MGSSRISGVRTNTYARMVLGVLASIFCHLTILAAQNKGNALQVTVDPTNGSYTVGVSGSASPVLKSGVAVQLENRWLKSADYPKHEVVKAKVSDDLGTAEQWTVTFSGLSGEPDLIYVLRAYPDQPFADIQVFVKNSTTKPIQVEDIRSVDESGNSVLDLGGPAIEDRVLSDSFSEDQPPLKIHDLADAENQMQRGFGSQLIYNRQSHRSIFLGALTSDRFLTILRIHLAGDAKQPHIASYEVDATGTTEITKEGSLMDSPPEDKMPLKLQVDPGAELPSERLLLGVDTEYHRQLETYGSIIRQLHHARVTTPTPMGWWSWAAYYNGLNEGTAMTNAQWLTQHLKPLGYNFFFIDDGYMYARGEYATPDATLFPHGMDSLERKASGLGLITGVWTAPFEVSERSWVYQNHRDWLVHNAKGSPIHLGWVSDDKDDRLFALDTTNPGAQDYLRKTYSEMVNVWGLRYIKMDFMDDSSVEGKFYRPNTTAMEAQRIGFSIIRQTVGNDVLLDKDGGMMLNPVGYVDLGRISQDTGHAFESSTKVAAPGIAARYYMNRNFYVSDPDAFSVSTQTLKDQLAWHGGHRPLTLDEAKVSLALAAVAGGMYEIGDDLPTLGSEPERLALIQNKDMIDMVRLGRAATPVDLMTYLPEDEQPSIFFLKEDGRQSVLTIFNWTEHARTHAIKLADFGLKGKGPYTVFDILDKKKISISPSNSLVVSQPLHSVRVLKIVDTGIAAKAPVVQAQHPSTAKTGETVEFSANLATPETAVVSYRWDFGDGVILEGAKVSHAYTYANTYHVKLTVLGLDGLTGKDDFRIPVTGTIRTKFLPVAEQRRYKGSE